MLLCYSLNLLSSPYGELIALLSHITAWLVQRADKKWLHTLRVFSTHWIEQKIPVDIFPNSACEIRMMFVLSVQQILCGSRACRHNFKLFCAQKGILRRNFLILLKSPDKHSLLFAIIPLKSLTASEYTRKRCPHIPQIRRIKVRWSCRPVDWVSISNPASGESLVQVLSDSAVLP
jgi:hypothetical protein